MSTTDERQKSLLAEIRQHNEEIAHAASRRVIGSWSRARNTRAERASREARIAPDVQVERLAEMANDGFKRLGPVIGLSVLADEPGLILDDMAWLRRAFATRNVAPPAPDWEVQLLEAYAAACDEVLSARHTAAIHDIVDRAAASLSNA